MNKNADLLLKEFKVEVTNVLKNFDEVINSKLGDEVAIISSTEAVKRKATLQDTIDLYINEWADTVGALDEIGIDLEAEEILISNHQLVRFKLEEVIKVAREDGDVAEFEHKGVGLSYDSVALEPVGEDESILFLYRSDSNGVDMEVARIVLKGNIEYDVTGNGHYSNLVEVC